MAQLLLNRGANVNFTPQVRLSGRPRTQAPLLSPWCPDFLRPARCLWVAACVCEASCRGLLHTCPQFSSARSRGGKPGGRQLALLRSLMLALGAMGVPAALTIVVWHP